MTKEEQRAELRRLVWAATYAHDFKAEGANEAVEMFDKLDDEDLPLVEEESHGERLQRHRQEAHAQRGAQADLKKRISQT